jgi:hypothetical protein
MNQYRIFPEKIPEEIEPQPLIATPKGEIVQDATWAETMNKISVIWVVLLGLPIFLVLTVLLFMHPIDGILSCLAVPVVSFGIPCLILLPLEFWKLHRYYRSDKYKQAMVKAEKQRQQEEIQRWQAEMQRREAEAESEAQALTSRAIDILESSMALETSCWASFQEASTAMQQAQYEFDDRAFSPFWDAIEGAIYHLSSFNDAILQLPYKHREYYSILQGRKHTFPPFPITPESLPNPTPIINELYNLVRQGQKDFQFALIWEQIKTREVLIAGFTTLADAIKGIGETISESISNMARGLFPPHPVQ